MGHQDLIYSFVARGTVVVAEYTEFTGNFISVATQCLHKLPASNNGLIHGSGIEYTVDLSIPSSAKEDANGVFIKIDGPYRVKDVRINGEPLDPEKDYTVAMVNYLQEGGDGFSMMKDAEILRYTQKVESDIIAEYIEQNLGGVVPEKYNVVENRIKLTGFTEKKE